MMMKTPGAIKERIAYIRDRLCLSQLEFAEEVGITQGALSQLESGKSKLSLDTIRKISHTYSVNCNWLINGDGDMLMKEESPGVDVSVANSHEEGLIPLINEEARAGYIERCQDLEFISTLDVYKIPGYEVGNYRLFEIEGDSMLPTIHPREIVVAEKVETTENLENGTLCIVIAEDGIVAKRAYQDELDMSLLILKSDNADFKTYTLKLDEVIEIWEIKAKITNVFAQEQLISAARMETLESDIQELKQKMSEVYKNTQPVKD
ncbi:LexA family transcriptional regulator [Exilibacterium tricleocarpae]|uniref:LexA family transcriptional regulator n=1 Tax=Exilibacterium tricleocarpae TaxID=2591008 RepID=A0A545SN74_9GAMM|nr:LexA family transcriptional regulator [Exilibacterium tricleocarpae]TQV66316.1 LexA family transcriptional regulator [Exilibacterium tricleocarpae]